MSEDTRKEHVVTIGGIEHTMLLTEDDVKRYGDAAKAATAPVNKARAAQNKGA